MSDSNQTLSTPLAELARLQTALSEITATLRSEREQLRARGINLPPLVMQTLTGVAAEFDALEHLLTAEQIELGQLRSLVDSGAMISASFDTDRVLNRAMGIIITLTGAERGYIILVDAQTGALDFRVQSEPDVTGQHNLAAPDPHISQSVVRAVLTSGQPLLTDSAHEDARFAGQKSVAAMMLRSVLCVPLRYKDDVIGVVYVDNRIRAGMFSERELNLLAAFANQVAVALTNARLYSDIRQALGEIMTVRELTGSVFESVGSGILTTDAAGVITMYNEAAADILDGLRDHDGMRLQDALHSEAVGDVLAEVRLTRTPQAIEAEVTSPSGKRLYAGIKVAPLRNAQPSGEGLVVVIDDLTEQQERSAMLNIMRRYLPPQMVDNIHTISGLDLGGERRDVTCMFVNVRPVSTLPDGLRPQAIMAQINGYLAGATDCIHAVGGVIDKYMGTEIMALFNTQLNPQPDHAVRAVEAALRIRDHLAARDGGAGHFRIGIHSGEATLGNVGSFARRDFTAIGDAINLAKRLEENATSGQIIVSADTHARIDADGLRFEVRGPLQVKGRTGAAPVYEAFRA
ncbi:MAG TPA: adenylate/guanylate cyclase domain-containing protein [Aggregatilineales bacterium]|nr:adenylate/guanylate cyclase domain-containing protein [Aggregatilineales bacterium]